MANQESSSLWQVGLARRDITPTEPMPLAGYANRTEPFESIATPLALNALALQDFAGARALLITADFIGFDASLAGTIRGELVRRGELSPDAILLNGSHTHFGPQAIRAWIENAPQYADVSERYIERLASLAVEAGLEALSAMRPARLSWGAGVALFVINRREFTDHGVVLGANPRGLADRTAPVLRIDDELGNVRAVLFGAAAHCVTCVSHPLEINGDYAASARIELERRYPGAQAMFILGCAGDARPHPKGDKAHAAMHGAALPEEVSRVLESGTLNPVRGPLRTALDYADLPLRHFETLEQLEAYAGEASSHHRFFVDKALALMRDGKPIPRTYPAPFALWNFGGDLALVGYSGETLVDYVPLAERVLGPRRLWIAGYCNDKYGYLPSPKVLEEGGYETRGLYCEIGLFTPEVFDVVAQSLERLKLATEWTRAGVD